MTVKDKANPKETDDKQQKQPPGAKKPQDYVRPAGPGKAGIDPKEWDEVDEDIDESFPASDPPSHY